MAIQLPNPGLGDGQTGDNEFVMWTKTKDNFSNQTHAASRMIGYQAGQIPLAQDIYKAMSAGTKPILSDVTASNYPDEASIPIGTSIVLAGAASYPWLVPTGSSYIITRVDINSYSTLEAIQRTSGRRFWRQKDNMGVWSDWFEALTTFNTKIDTNGAYAPSSPTIELHKNYIEANADAQKTNPEFIRNGVGDYTIKNTTGLRENDGWYIKIPNDKYGNPKVLAEIEQADNGDLSIKTYGRKFDYEVAGVVPDLDNPLDIPEGRWIDLRFNDLPFDDDKTEV